MARAVRSLGVCLAAERDRWVLWLAVAFGVGIGVYFSLPAEPPLWLGAALAGTAAVGGLLLRGRAIAATCILVMLAAALGFTAAQWRTQTVAAPVLAERMINVRVDGTLARIESRETGVRLTLEDPRIEGLRDAATPARVRMTLRELPPGIVPGARIRLRGTLMPPPGPAAPGAFDFQRYAYFHRIGAVGYAFGAPEVLSASEIGGLSATVERLRHAATQRIRAAVPGESGAVAAALLTGERGGIPEPALDAMRDAGLAHLLAISGLHVGMVMLMFLGIFRFGLAALPPVALRIDAKKWAAVGALVAGLGYVLLSGATTPTLRAFTMFAAALTGLMVDREGLSLRMVAFAAVLILALAPESLLSASFQMSFAAAIALIAAYEAWQAYRARRPRERNGTARRFARTGGGVAFTTVVASSATAPYAIYHFNRLAVFGLAANMIAVPLTAMWILPMGILGLLLMPLGLEEAPLALMAVGIDLVLSIAREVSSWPGSVALLPALSTAGLVLLSVGALWLAIWRRRWRLAGIPLIAAGLASGSLVTPPDLLIADDGRLVAIRDGEDRLTVSTEVGRRFDGEVWLRRAAQEQARTWPEAGARGRLRCDALGCLFRRYGRSVAIVRDPMALPDDCRSAQIIVIRGYLRLYCPSARYVIDRFELWRNGSHAVWIGDEGALTVVNAREARGRRPWVLDPYATMSERNEGRRADADRE